MILTKTDLITTIGHRTSTTKGLQSKFQKKKFLFEKKNCKTEDNIPATIIQMKIKNKKIYIRY